jgi:hypothetical protein
MPKTLWAAAIVYGTWCTPVLPLTAQATTETGPQAVADAVLEQFNGIAQATNTLNLDRLLGYYEQSDALTYVARGRITRSYRTFSELVRTQLGGLSTADLRLIDTYVDVLSADVAVATATYTFTASFPSGSSVQTRGTFTCVFVHTDGRWLVRYSEHTFPAAGA